MLPSADGAALAACILEWCGDRDRLEISGRRARAAAEARGLTQAVRAFESVLEEIANPPTRMGA